MTLTEQCVLAQQALILQLFGLFAADLLPVCHETSWQKCWLTVKGLEEEIPYDQCPPIKEKSTFS